MNEAEKQQTAEGLTTGYCVSLLHYYFYFSSGGFVKALKEFSVRCLSDSSIGPRSAPDADVSIFIQILYYDNLFLWCWAGKSTIIPFKSPNPNNRYMQSLYRYIFPYDSTPGYSRLNA